MKNSIEKDAVRKLRTIVASALHSKLAECWNVSDYERFFNKMTVIDVSTFFEHDFKLFSLKIRNVLLSFDVTAGCYS